MPVGTRFLMWGISIFLYCMALRIAMLEGDFGLAKIVALQASGFFIFMASFFVSSKKGA